jgi:2-amino-4-hydroxy-6-hydroxymethyldihydropteridine diphosphokinase
MNKVAVLLGNNIDDGRDYFFEARAEISNQLGQIIQTSSVYLSPPWGYESSNFYKNQIVICNTTLPAISVLKMILHIETGLGRVRNSSSAKYEDRTIDIDILLFNEDIIKLEELEIPHPRMHLRKFCLLPLAEVVGNWFVPPFNCTVNELLMQCADQSEVVKA